jgi:hypothetical protein
MVVEGLTMVFYIKNLRHPETNSKQHTFKKQDEREIVGMTWMTLILNMLQK